MKQMARRRLVKWPDGSYYMPGDRSLLDLTDRDRHSPPLTRRERIRLVKGYAAATLLVVLFVCAVALAAGSQ